MLIASISEGLDAEWTRVSPVRVGPVPTSFSTPNLYVMVADGGTPVLRIDVHAFGRDSFAFQDALIWRDNVVVGFGSHVHAISLADHSVVTVDLGSYYGHMYPAPDYLLIASAERLFRMEPARSILWKTDLLAVDGVVVHEPGPPIIRGDAELDPPGGWAPFAVLASDGSAVL